MQYVPLWIDIIDGPSWKILDLPADVYRFWSLCLLAAQKFDFVEGYLPDERTLAAWLHMDRDTTVTLRDIAVTCHVLDHTDDGQYKIHDWEHWRNTKDPTAAARKRKQRAKEKEVTSNVTDESRNGHAPVTDMSNDVTPQITTLNSQQTTFNRQQPSPLPPVTGGVVESSSEEKFPEFPDWRTTIIAVQIGEHDIPETEARKIWGHLWRAWKSSKLCFGFYEMQRGISVKGWLYAIETAVKQGKEPGHIKYLQKIGMDFDINGPKREKPLNRGSIGPVEYVPTYERGTNAPAVDISQHVLEAERLTKLMIEKGMIR